MKCVLYLCNIFNIIYNIQLLVKLINKNIILHTRLNFKTE